MAETFKLGDKVSWNIGSDVYVGTVQRVGANGVVVRPTGAVIVYRKFTLRKDGSYKLARQNFGKLVLGGEAYRDPSF
jgi:hypothetical protein